jgi:hypothetical protein
MFILVEFRLQMSSHQPLLLAMVEKPDTEVHTDNRLRPSVLSGRVSSIVEEIIKGLDKAT